MVLVDSRSFICVKVSFPPMYFRRKYIGGNDTFTQMKERLSTRTIAMRISKEFYDGAVVNLGMCIPTLCALYVPEGIRVVFQAETGVLGYGAPFTEEQKDQWDSDLL